MFRQVLRIRLAATREGRSYQHLPPYESRGLREYALAECLWCVLFGGNERPGEGEISHSGRAKKLSSGGDKNASRKILISVTWCALGLGRLLSGGLIQAKVHGVAWT